MCLVNQKLNLIIVLAIGVLGGSILSHYLLPMPVFAQSQAPVLVPGSAQHVTLATASGINLGDFDLNKGTIKLFPVVKLHMDKTDRTVTLELSPGENSK